MLKYLTAYFFPVLNSRCFYTKPDIKALNPVGLHHLNCCSFYVFKLDFFVSAFLVDQHHGLIFFSTSWNGDFLRDRPGYTSYEGWGGGGGGGGWGTE